MFSRDFLHAAKQHIGRRVRARQRHTQPAHQSAKERVEHAGIGKGQTQGGVGAGIAGEVAQRQHQHNGQQRVANQPQGGEENTHHVEGVVFHYQAAHDGRQQNAGAGGRQQVERVNGAFCFRNGNYGRHLLNQVVQTIHHELRCKNPIQIGFHRRQSPNKDEDREDGPRGPSADDLIA